MGQRDFVKLTIPNDPAYLPIVRSCAGRFARKCGLGDEETYDVQLGIEEVCSGVIEHSFEPGEEGSFDVVCERIPLGVRMIVREKGIPFDPDQVPDYRPGAEEGVAYDSLHLFLVKKVMDQVSFHNLGPEGRETHLVKYLRGQSVEGCVPPAEIEREEVPAAPEAIEEKIPYDVRRLEPREAIEVSRCAYKSHGYTFFDEHIYYPERIVELNRSGMMVSAVAVTKGSVFMGHAALVFPDPVARIAELTYVFVNVEYRGQGCMTRLCDFLFRLPLGRRLDGLYAYAVTNHVFTQRVMLKYGFHDCGILLASSPATWVFKGIAGEASQRISVALSFRYLTDPPPVTLFPPSRHRAMVEKIYSNIKGRHRCIAPPGSEAALPPAASATSVEVFPSENCAEVYVVRYGADIVGAVKRILRQLCVKGVASVSLSLPLEDPKTHFHAPHFEEMGFFFAGVLPGSKIGDALLLQYLNNVELDYGKILAHTEMAKEILAYVRRNDPNAGENP